MNKSFLLLLSLMLMSFTVVKAQEKGRFMDQMKGRPLIKKGDKAYQSRSYEEAKQYFQAAENKLGTPITLLMRQANLAYRTESWQDAKTYYNDALETEGLSKEQKYWLNFNQGNVFMKEEQWNEAIESYKKALKLKPNDSKAKYNLSYALLKRQQDDQDQNQQQDKDEQDSKDEQQESNDQQDEQKEDQDQNQDKLEEPAPKPNNSQLSQEQAERILQGLREKEKALLEATEQEGGGQRVLDKDW